MMPTDNREQNLLDRALEILKRTTGIHGRVIERELNDGHGGRADAIVEIEVNGQRHPYAAEIKRVDRFAILRDIKNQPPLYGRAPQPLLVAPRITTETAEKCRELDLQFIDATGNAYLRGPGLYVLVKGQRPLEGEDLLLIGQEGNKRAGTATHLRVIFALLCQPELLNAPYRDIVQAAGVALGTIGWVFYDLTDRGLVGGKRKGHRAMLERKKLSNEWITNYPIKLRPKLNPRRFKAPKPD